jgi:hypothetical protein
MFPKWDEVPTHTVRYLGRVVLDENDDADSHALLHQLARARTKCGRIVKIITPEKFTFGNLLNCISVRLENMVSL